MGNGSRWTQRSFDSYAAATGYTTAQRDEVFSHNFNPRLDPAIMRVGGEGPRSGLQLRESCDSDINPNSTPIILALDVTGSMGEVAQQIAQTELPKLMRGIHENRVVEDPHIMFMGFDDVHVMDHAALQVSQFEPDIRIVEQLRDMWLTSKGGGNGSESYDLPWYFAAKYTYTDSFAKRGNKGLLFTFGDEPAPFQKMSDRQLKSVFGPGNYEAVTPQQCLKMAQEKYDVFHIHCTHDRQVRSYGDLEAVATWTKMLGNNLLVLTDTSKLTELVLATIEIHHGADINTVINYSSCPDVLTTAFQNALGRGERQ